MPESNLSLSPLNESEAANASPEVEFVDGASGGRVPPQAVSAEKSVLGAVLVNNESLNTVIEVLRPEDFYQKSHSILFRAMMQLYEESKPIDVITLSDRLRGNGELDAVGGAEYLSHLIDIVPISANTGYHSRLVKEMSIRRQLINKVSEIADEAYNASGAIDAFMDSVEQRIFSVSESRITPGFVRVGDIVKDSIKQVEQRYINNEPITGVPTGFVDLDGLTSGFQESDLVIIAGRPSMGKTSLALSMARYMGVEADLALAFFSLEMSKEQVVTRLLCSEGKVSSSKVRNGKLGETDFPKLVDAASKISQAKIYVDDTPAISVLEMRAKARRLHKENPLSIIMVDYLQLMRGSSRRVERREQEISEISSGLKALAKELKVP